MLTFTRNPPGGWNTLPRTPPGGWNTLTRTSPGVCQTFIKDAVIVGEMMNISMVYVDKMTYTHWPTSIALRHLGLIVSKCSKVGVRMWFKSTKHSDQTNFEPKVLYEWNQGHWNVLGVAAFLRPKYRNSLVMKIYKRRSHHVTCLANMADKAR